MLKDEESQIDCELWGSKQISFMPSDGMRVNRPQKQPEKTTKGIKNTALVTNAPKPKVISTNKCGWGKFKESVKPPVNYFGTDASNPITITPGNTPVCTKVPADPNNPGALPTYTSTEDAPVGTARRTADGYIFYKGANIQTAVSTFVGTGTTKKAKANQCGLVAFNLSNGTDPVVTILIAAA